VPACNSKLPARSATIFAGIAFVSTLIGTILYAAVSIFARPTSPCTRTYLPLLTSPLLAG
jgi:sorbitol-specific phosphotransferase system component IIBC